MSYFGGLGAGKGWHSFRFIVTPDELQSIFLDLEYWFVITDQRVPINYFVEDKTSLFNNYKLYFEKIFSGEPFLKEDWKIESGIRISITDDSTKVGFLPILDMKIKDAGKFKLVRPTEPVIGIAPFSIHQIEPNTLSVVYSDSARNIGLQFIYPKLISLESEEHQFFHKTNAFSTYSLYFDLQKRIKKISKKAKVMWNEKLLKPNFWISPTCVEIFQHNFNNKKDNIRAI